MESKEKYVCGGISVPFDMLEIVKIIDKQCHGFGFIADEDLKLKALGIKLICEGIKIGTIEEHKRMQEAYGEAIPLINKCVDFVEFIRRVELGIATPKGKA